MHSDARRNDRARPAGVRTAAQITHPNAPGGREEPTLPRTDDFDLECVAFMPFRQPAEVADGGLPEHPEAAGVGPRWHSGVAGGWWPNHEDRQAAVHHPARHPRRPTLGECETSSNRNGGMAAQPYKSCRPRSTSQSGRAPTFPTAFRRTASEPGPTGRRAAHLRSEAGQGHGRFLPVTLPRERPDQHKRTEAGAHRSPTSGGPIRGGVGGPIRGGIRGVIGGPIQGESKA